MEELTQTESTETVEVNDVENMSDEQFDNYMDGDNATTANEDAQEQPLAAEGEEVDLNDLYSAQIGNTEAKLAEPVLLKLNGKVIKVDDLNDLRNMAEKSIGVTKKFQAIAEHKKTLQFLEDNNLSMDDLNQLITSRGQDPIVQDEVAIETETIAQEILDSDYSDDFRSTAGMLPDDVKDMMGNNPQLMQDFYGDVQSGLAQKIMPQVEQLMAVKGMGFYEAYATAGQSIVGSDDTMEQKKQMLRSAPKPNSQSLNGNNADIWNMSDSEFSKYMDG